MLVLPFQIITAKKASEIINKYIFDREKIIEMGISSKKLSQSFSIEKNFLFLKIL